MDTIKIGTILYENRNIVLNKGKQMTELIVTNMGDRPIQVGSHYHFFECNFALKFNREKAYGKHLDIPAGTAVRFDPGEDTKVQLVDYSGRQRIMGFNGMTMGDIKDEQIRKKAFERIHVREREGC